MKCGLFILSEMTQNSDLWFGCEIGGGYLADLRSRSLSAVGLENSSLSSSAALQPLTYETTVNP